MPRFLSFLLAFLFILSCQERERNNPFDPDNDEKYIHIGLTLSATDSQINLSWFIPNDPDINAFAIYRRIENEGDFRLLTNLANTVSGYTDIVSELDIRYYYYVTLVGDGVESSPTETKSITPGPGRIWILDDFLWEILKLNYDLGSYSLRKLGIWKPENLALAYEIGKGLITYPVFDYIEIFDLQNGKFLYDTQAIRRPFDAVYDENLNIFWLIDSLGSLYYVDSTANERLIGKFFKKPIQIDLLDNFVVVLDRGLNSLALFERSSAHIDFIDKNETENSFKDLSLFRVDKQNKNIYFLDKERNKNTLYKFNIENRNVSFVYQDSLIHTFDINQQDESIWIIIANKLNSEAMQLSSTGQRLVTLQGFNMPRDIKVNPYNGNVIIADITNQVNLLTEKVFHYRSNELIGSFRTYGDPFKVYIE